jgi:alpha-ribazole phosphatase
MTAGSEPAFLHAWRHPLAAGAEGRCIGRTDLRCDPRRAKRLAHRIRSFARRRALPRIVITSPLQRSRAVGRWLARWGWQHHVHASLCELDFGRWDGSPWAALPRPEFDAWCADFEHHAPGGGESVAALLQRVRRFDPGPARIVVTHGGWLSAALWLRHRRAGEAPSSARWPPAPRCGGRLDLPPPLHSGASTMEDSQLVVPPSFVALFVPEGRLKPTESREVIGARYELCEDLAQMLEETASSKRFELGVTEEDVLERIHQGLEAGGVVSVAEALWVVRRLAEIIAWPLPEPLRPAPPAGRG